MLRRKIAEFMRGRYGGTGVDKLNFALLIFGFVVYFVSLFLRNYAVWYVLIGVEIACYLWVTFRLFSRNIYARQKENAAFVKFFSKVKKFFKLQKDRIKDRKEYRYKACPHCKVVLRLPAKKGEHTVKCPKCGERFKVNNIF